MKCDEAAGRAKRASVVLGSLSSKEKNNALEAVRRALLDNSRAILDANARDLARSQREGLAAPLLKRLKFDEAKLRDACAGIESLMALPDPVGTVLSARELDRGLELYQVTCPIGVIGIIFESRPDALVQISTLCLKSGNAVLLKGGREAAETNRVLYAAVAEASLRAGLPEGWIGLLETREDVADMLALQDSVDLIIPRGSNEFVRHIMKNTTIPVMGHSDGVCHIYVHEDADLPMAEAVVVDSKTQYVAVCNALETLLVHRAVAGKVLPRLKKALDAKGVEIRGCEETRAVIDCAAAVEEDWKTEYLDYVLSIRVVGSQDEAIDHINTYGSRHTDGIVTASREKAELFMDRVDSADVFWNASTRFSDGYRYGLGAEVGISTGKLHSRGPVGLEGLVIYKWRLYGSGQTAADYAGGGKTFTHRELPKKLPPRI
jgi:glutamate-5-semialdehyde dehydrogenase